MTQYFRLNYFYSRKDSGSYYITLENDKELDEDLDEDEIIDMAVKTNQISSDVSDSIVNIEAIDEDEFNIVSK